MLVSEGRADHIDLNFGCPVPKVTRKGGGAALPWKQDLFASIVQAAVKGAEGLPVTVKMRKGIDANHLTFLDSGKAARDAGVTAVALHARTASEYYSGQADWAAIAELREALPDVQVLGNGDIWSADDAVRMMKQTGVDGIVVGRGCLGRPWLFADLEQAISRYLAGEQNPSVEVVAPNLGEVADAFYRHAELLVEFFEDEGRACRDIRKHVAWYFKGYPVGGELRAKLAQVPDLSSMQELLSELDRSVPYPGAEAEGPRGRLGGVKSCALPEHWLDSRELGDKARFELLEAELSVSGG
jgi:nifR3 family TIM-barrel protein